MTTITAIDAQAWNMLANVVCNFLSKKKADNYRSMVEELLSSSSSSLAKRELVFAK